MATYLKMKIEQTNCRQKHYIGQSTLVRLVACPFINLRRLFSTKIDTFGNSNNTTAYIL